ncbi:MAG: protein-glutamate O-methyltransferase CheR [Pseudomonadota bacterium]
MIWSFKKLGDLPQQEFVLWESLLEKRTGIQLAQSHHVLLQTQVSMRMRELGIETYDKYYDYVNDEVAEWQVLVDRLVVKETTFFRHRPSLDFVKQFLHKLTRQSVSFDQGHKSLEIWSVGCSTGEEPYTLAAIVNDHFEAQNRQAYFGVTASDISLPALSIAREGVYSERSLSLVSDKERDAYFEPYSDGRYRVIDKFRKRVCFSQYNVLNLRDKPVQLMDIIFCQNLLIYFRRWRRRKILDQLVRHLKPGGILVIGLGEITDWQHDHMQRVANEEVQTYIKIA